MARVEELFSVMGMMVVTGSRYIGGLIGNKEAEDTSLTERVQGWAEPVKTFGGRPQATVFR